MSTIAIALLGVFLFAASSASAQSPAAPCTAPAHRESDFWLGDWNVTGPKGALVGTNSINREYGGCVLHERYDTGRGYRGESLNIYDGPRRVWHQTWVDSSGLLLLLEGGLKDGEMVLEGSASSPDGRFTRHRITWTPNLDGSVRQLW